MEKKKDQKTVKELLKNYDKIIKKQDQREDSNELFKKMIKNAANNTKQHASKSR